MGQGRVCGGEERLGGTGWGAVGRGGALLKPTQNMEYSEDSLPLLSPSGVRK